jgi:hypothetical protein
MRRFSKSTSREYTLSKCEPAGTSAKRKVFDREIGTVKGFPFDVMTALDVDGRAAGFGRKVVAGTSTLMRTAAVRKGRTAERNSNDERECIVNVDTMVEVVDGRGLDSW